MNIFKKIFGDSQTNMKEEIKMTNTQKALELINTFANGDTEKAASLLAEGYIQHNLATAQDATLLLVRLPTLLLPLSRLW